MIQSFKSKGTEALYHGERNRDALKIPQNIWNTTCRKQDLLNAAMGIEDLRSPPGNRLEPLKGNLKGKWSIRVNDQFRLIFRFENGHAHEVEIVDYH